jgi:molybdopterin synthase catalytic subunit
MILHIKLFAGAREAVGAREVRLDVPENLTAAEVLTRLGERYPRLGPMLASLRLAVNREYVRSDHRLRQDDEVALIPPVSGGSDLFEVTPDPLSLDAVIRGVSRTTSGAVSSFLGIVREFSRGRQVTLLEYEAYPEMASSTMQTIGSEIRERWQVDAVAIVHRVGRLEVGEASVAIAVAAAHRREALEACAYAIERLKAVVPIWKREVWSDGSEWIGSTVDEYRELHAEAQRPERAEAPSRPSTPSP